MGLCNHCQKKSKTISDVIGFCVDCIRDHFDEVWPHIKNVHDESRDAFGLPTAPPIHRWELNAPFACMVVRYLKGTRDFVDCAVLKMAQFEEAAPMRAMFIITMTLSPPTASAALFVLQGRVVVIRLTACERALNMGIRIWLSFITPVLSTACIVKTTISRTTHPQSTNSAQRIWLTQSTKKPPVFAISEATQRLRSFMLSRPPNSRWRKLPKEFFGFAGKQTVPFRRPI